MSRVPHLRVVVAFCLIAIVGYAIGSMWAVFGPGDPALKGDVIGTWKSFAVLAFGFWLGSSSGGKAQASEPIAATIVNTADEPVPTTDLPSPTFGKDT